MARYGIQKATYAQEQYDSLSPAGKVVVDQALDEVADGPEAGSFDEGAHRWTWRTPDVILTYDIKEQFVLVLILRILSLK